MSVLDQIRRPEYTGENRCTPCTVVNVGIAIVVSSLSIIASPVLAAGVFALSLVLIYLRGYLVPGTPTLTKQYFPENVLRWFDKSQSTTAVDGSVKINPEQVLLDAGAVEPCREKTDICLTPEFHEAWQERIRSSELGDAGEAELSRAIDPQSDVAIFENGDAFVARTEDNVIGQWSSQAAVISDVAAEKELAEQHPEWEQLSPAETARVLFSLRIFIEWCPECDGSVVVEQEAVESCCRSYDVIAAACQDCESRLFEMEWDEPTQSETDLGSGEDSPHIRTVG